MEIVDQEGQEGQEVHGQRRLVRSTKDRLAVVVTGPELEGEHLLCTPGLEGGTAVEQAEALYAVLVKYNLDPYVASLVFDTTATNTGRHGGAVRLIQEYLGGGCPLYLAATCPAMLVAAHLVSGLGKATAVLFLADVCRATTKGINKIQVLLLILAKMNPTVGHIWGS